MNTADNQKTTIDVAEEFDYSTQDKNYSIDFHRWRKNKNNPFAFNFSLNKKETIFIDGKGFVNKSPSVPERETINKIFYIIGSAMLMWIVIENILGKIIIYILDIIGINIHTTFFSMSYYGGSIEIVSTLILVSLIKIYIPIFYLHRKLKMPFSVELMHTMSHPTGLIYTMSLTLIVCTIISIPDAYSGTAREVYEYFRNVDTDISVWGQAEYIIYIISDIIIISVLSEILFRGAVFSALRQFGDIFAIIITSLMSALLTQNLIDMPSVFVISLIASVGMLWSGSIFTAFAVRVIFKMYQLTIIIIESSESENMFLVRSLVMSAIFIASILTVIIINMKTRNKKHKYIAEYKSDVPAHQRFIWGFRTFPFTAVSAVCIIASLLKIIY